MRALLPGNLCLSVNERGYKEMSHLEKLLPRLPPAAIEALMVWDGHFRDTQGRAALLGFTSLDTVDKRRMRG